MKHRYSGNKSRKFWKRISRFSGTPPHDALYSAGVELQNLEEAVLQALELAEKQYGITFEKKQKKHLGTAQEAIDKIKKLKFKKKK